MPSLVVRGLSRAATQGKLQVGALSFPCAVGRSGRGPKRREGDGVTPMGRWQIRHVFYRPDRLQKPVTALPISPLRPCYGWCDAPGDANYNRLIRLPFASSRELLWREDGLYDVVAVLGYNDWPRAHWRGSGIFMHIAREGYAPTEGCVALSREHILRVIRMLGPRTTLIIK